MTRICRSVIVIVMAGLTLAACTGPAPAARQPPRHRTEALPSGLTDRPVASRGCGRQPAVQPGTTATVTVAVPPASSGGATQRTFLLHVPAGYSSGRRASLVLALHGGNGTAAQMESSSGLSALSDRTSSGFRRQGLSRSTLRPAPRARCGSRSSTPTRSAGSARPG